MLHTFTNMLIYCIIRLCTVYGFCDNSALLLLKNTIDAFLRLEFRILKCLPSFTIHCVKVIRFPVIMFHLNEDVNKMWRN